MDKQSIIKSYFDKIRKNKETLQKRQSWGEYVSCALVEEFIRQAVEDACFFMQQHKVRLIDEEKKAKTDLKTSLLSLKVQQHFILKDAENPLNSPLPSFTFLIGKQNNMKFTVKNVDYGYKITRVK